MATFNPQNAVVYGLTAYQFNSLFTDSLENLQTPLGQVLSVNNSYATVYPFTTSNLTASNAQAVEDLFPSVNSGSNLYFTINFGTSSFDYQSSFFAPFSNTSAVQISSATPTTTADLSNGVLTAQETSTQYTSLEFTFLPGVTQSVSVTYSQGTTLSSSVTNGITNSVTDGETTTVTTGASATGSLPGASSTVSTSVANAWSVQQTEQLNYSNSETATVNTNQSSTVDVNVDSATENSDGTYSWTSTDGGGTFTLIPGNLYVAQVEVDVNDYSTPVNNNFIISGPDMSLSMFIKYYGFSPDLEVSYEAEAQENVSTSINLANMNYGYSQYSGVDTSLFTPQTGSVDGLEYQGQINSQSSSNTNAVTVIVPVATTSDAATPISSSMTSQNASSAAPMMSISPASGTTKLDLEAAASKLSSSYGIYYNNTNSEQEIKTKHVDISGYDHATVNVGNLDYTFTNFSDSTISTGSGNNKVILVAGDVNNSIKFGAGNNEVDLNGNHNTIRMGGGANWVDVTGGAGTNFVVAGDGPTVLTFNNSKGFTQVSNWDTSEDAILFSPDISRNDVHIMFDSTHWAYDVYVNNEYVANILTTGGLKFADENSIVYSQTYAAPMPYNLQSNVGFANGLYVDAFERSADSSGLSYWTEQLDAGVSRKSVIQDFLVSGEYNLNHLSNSQYVNGLYQDILGRREDAFGAAYWEGQLDSGASRVAVVGAFLASAEFNNLVGISQ